MSGEPRSIEETEREVAAANLRLSQLVTDRGNGVDRRALNVVEAERDSLLTRVSELEARFDQEDYWKRGFEDARVKLVAAESRIGSLVGEREELREALREIDRETMYRSDPVSAKVGMMARIALSSRETTDEPAARAAREIDPFVPAGVNRDGERMLQPRRYSPTCPTCGSDDPKVRGHWHYRNIIEGTKVGAGRVCFQDEPMGNAFLDFCTDTFHSTPPSVGGDDSGKDRTTLNDILDHQGEL